MRLFGCLIAENEADIIGELLDHLRAIAAFEKICFFDLGSTDGTLEVPQAHRDVLHEPQVIADPFTNALKIELLLRNRHLYRDSDWLAVVDADEFYARDPREVLARASSSAR